MMSATDLVTLARTLRNGGVGPNGVRILSAVSAARMTEPCGTLAAPAYQVGLGWMIGPGGVLTHTGVGPGVYSMLFADPQSDRVVVLLTNCDRGNVLRPAIVEPILESWTGIPQRVVRPECDTVNPWPYEGVFENNLQRTEVLVRDTGLAMRVKLKMNLYDNSPYGRSANERSPSTLYPLGNDVFEADPLLPGGAKVELKFVQPRTDGRMRYLGMGYRLLARTQ
jgi:CubicO group peptidase (beta-lactamase class C family)